MTTHLRSLPMRNANTETMYRVFTPIYARPIYSFIGLLHTSPIQHSPHTPVPSRTFGSNVIHSDLIGSSFIPPRYTFVISHPLLCTVLCCAAALPRLFWTRGNCELLNGDNMGGMADPSFEFFFARVTRLILYRIAAPTPKERTKKLIV